MLRDLNTATNDDMKSKIQRQLEKAEKEICERKGRVNYWERQLNQEEGELKKEGEFHVSNTII